MFFFIEELAMIMDRLYGGVCYAGIDTDPELKYPKGAGRVAFLNQQSYIAAISARFVHLQMSEMDKRVNNFVNYGGGGNFVVYMQSLQLLYHHSICVFKSQINGSS